MSFNVTTSTVCTVELRLIENPLIQTIAISILQTTLNPNFEILKLELKFREDEKKNCLVYIHFLIYDEIQIFIRNVDDENYL